MERQQGEGWGTSVVERLAADLRDAFPDMRDGAYSESEVPCRPSGKQKVHYELRRQECLTVKCEPFSQKN
jgi:hypothetical protein